MNFKLLTAMLFLSSICGLAQEVAMPTEGGWMGIRVLETSRAEVEKLLGSKVNPPIAMSDSYRKSGVLVHITYSSAPCSDNNWGKYSVPKDTVFLYRIMFATSNVKEVIYINQLPFDLDKYERYEPLHDYGRVYYGRRDKGIGFESIMTEDGEYLSNMTFFPAAEMQEKYRCESKEEQSQFQKRNQ